MVQVKGSTLVPRWAYLEEKATPEQKARVLERLSPELRRDLEAGVLHNRWYPFEYLLQLVRALDQVLGRGDQALILELGKYAAEKVLPTIYRVFYKVGSPEYIIKRATRVWAQYYSSGRLTLVTLGPRKVKILLEDFATPAHEHCLSVQGWIIKTLEMSGARDIRLQQAQCRDRGGPVCEFVATWA